MNFNLHFGELHSDNSINDKNNLFENHIPKSYKVKRILISFNCFSEYINACKMHAFDSHFYSSHSEVAFNLYAKICRGQVLSICLNLWGPSK